MTVTLRSASSGMPAMPEPFHPQEIPAIRAAAQRALAARARIVAAAPAWETWRHQAKAIKRQVICQLDAYVHQLREQVEGWGGQVHEAADGHEANRLILSLARQHNCRLVVKAKSMTSEEIGLNTALGRAGITVVETDLGEFIIQLAGDTPSHLTAPAMHLNRRDIAMLFRERLGLSGEAEPAALSRQGATHLRRYFWQADMGITGVNCAAAASGHLVMLENEGNLRLSASAPPVHVAVMGLEKIIPQLADLEVLLRLLPTSATGQRLTAYVNFLAGLKPQPQGRQAFYLILLDNGRRRLAADPVFQEALFCLRCGACLNICPIFQVGGGHLYNHVYPGAIGIILAAFLGGEAVDLTDLCTQCGACAQICPVAIDLARLIVRLRQRSQHHPWLCRAVKLSSFLFQHPPLYRRLAYLGRRLLPPLPAIVDRAWWGQYRCVPFIPPKSFFEMITAAPMPPPDIET